MKIYLATKNKHKLEEARLALKPFKIEIEQLSETKIEPPNATIEKTALDNAARLANKYKKQVIVEDTGVYFTAFKNFPGSQPKRWFEKIGYKGLLKKLEGRQRDAYFKCAIGCCKPGEKPILFVGELNGMISHKAADLDKDVMPYERIFACRHNNEYLSRLSREEKNRISHRGIAFRKLGRYLTKMTNDDLKNDQ